MIRRPPRSTRVRSSAASDVYKRQGLSKLNAQGVAQGLDRGLGRAVGAEQGSVDGGGQGGYSEGIPAWMTDVGSRCAQCVVGAEDVDCQCAFEDIWVAADERQLSGDTRVGDHDVQAAQSGDHRLDRVIDL